MSEVAVHPAPYPSSAGLLSKERTIARPGFNRWLVRNRRKG